MKQPRIWIAINIWFWTLGVCLQQPVNAALPTASRESPTSSTLTIITGSSQTFVVRGTDTDGNLRGAEWYLNGSHQVSHFTMSGSSATDSWSYTFNSAGTFTVEALVFDTAGGYSSAARWTVTVQNNVAPVASRSSPSGSSVTLLPGSSQTFVVRGTDSNGNLRGAEWYLDGAHQVSHFTMSGSSDTDSWSRTFNSAGTFTVEALVFDTLNAYSSAARWTVSVQPDTTPPTPNPMTFSTAPYGYSTTSIRMVATQASDDWYSVEYYFYCALNGGGGGDYGFTANREYIDTGLSVNARYGYQVLARDTSPNHNQGSYSTTRYAYTLANTPSAPTVGGATGSSLNVDVQPNGNPSSTEFAVYNDTSGYYVNATGGNNGSAAVWRTDSQWGTVTVTGLSPNTPYSFKVKARNGDSVETVFGAAASGTTLSVNYPPTASRNGPKNANPNFMFVTGGTVIRFEVLASDQNGNLSAVDWYVNGQIRATHTISGPSSTDNWTYTFPSSGTYVVEAQPYDTQGAYATAALWTVNVVGKSRGMYVDKLDIYVGNPAATVSILEYAKRNSFNYLALYLGGVPLGNDLDRFVQLAKGSYGISEIGFVGGSTASFDGFLAFNNSHVGKADVFNLEYEYWNHNPRDFAAFKSILQYMRNIGSPQGLKVEAYVGWPTESETVELAGLVDRLFVHCYVTDPANAYSYGNAGGFYRLHWAGETANHVTIWPIFSAESTGYCADQPFMGDWLAAHSFGEAEDIFMASNRVDTDTRKYNIGLLGFQYYSFDYTSPLLFLTATAYAPAHLAENVGFTANLSITFNGNVSKGTSGNIIIKRASDHTVLETIPITDSRVTVADAQAQINPSGTFAGGTEYYVSIDATCFRSGAGAFYPGISVPGVWRFTTLPNPPAPPTANPATAMTTSSFAANWSTSGGATGYRLDVSTSSSFGSFVSGYGDLDVGNFTSKAVSGLNAGTTYYYRVRAYNTGGTSGNSGTITVVTVPAAPSANGASGITSDAFTANWNSTAGATGYRLDVSTNSGFADFVSGYQNLDVGNVVSQNVTGLGAGKTYYYRLRAYNGSGTSANSGTITVTTASSFVPVLGYAKSGNTLVLTWATNDSAFKLFYATNLPAAAWISNPVPPAVVSGQYAITNGITNNARFYRLKK